MKCVYCGGPVVRSPEGELVCSVCGSVQPSGVVQGVKGALSRSFDGASIEEYELPSGYVKRQIEAVKAWLKEQYVRAIVEIEEAHYGWMWFYAAMRRGGDLARYLTSTTMPKVAKFVIFVHKIVSSCRVPYPIDPERLKALMRSHGMQVRYNVQRYGGGIELYRNSEYAVLVDTLDVINALKRIHCEKKCGGSCGRSRGRSGHPSRAPQGDGGSPPSTVPS
mgnify:CR=1 FL=1